MTATESEKRLGTDASREVGQEDGTGESTGHASGRRVVELLRTGKGDLGEDDLAHMRKVTGCARPHLAQRPGGDTSDSRWRDYLMHGASSPWAARHPGSAPSAGPAGRHAEGDDETER
ncbi:DUF3140 domain-containing protein [Streptomyces sp. NPDC060198]|uniref:DUF3140 domain-containing protein n=1 Tax=Streptomyces sp. NPDC060198 TaxID=3347070 RepID=UPI00365B8487